MFPHAFAHTQKKLVLQQLQFIINAMTTRRNQKSYAMPTNGSAIRPSIAHACATHVNTCLAHFTAIANITEIGHAQGMTMPFAFARTTQHRRAKKSLKNQSRLRTAMITNARKITIACTAWAELAPSNAWLANVRHRRPTMTRRVMIIKFVRKASALIVQRHHRDQHRAKVHAQQRPANTKIVLRKHKSTVCAYQVWVLKDPAATPFWLAGSTNSQPNVNRQIALR
jgi:hypothetical protein